MKITKEKRDGDTHGFEFELEEGEKFVEFIAINYDNMKKVIEGHKTKIMNFNISSGKIVFTSLGQSEFCAKVMMKLPKGSWGAYTENNEEADSIFIPFRKFKYETIRYHLFINIFHLSWLPKIPEDIVETECIQIQHTPLFIMDEKDWLKHKSIIYKGGDDSYAKRIEDVNNTNLDTSVILPFDGDNSLKLNESDGTEASYFAYCGYTLNGDPAYLWLRKRKEKIQE